MARIGKGPAQLPDVMRNYQWYFIPVVFSVAFVPSFVFVGDGLRDAADPSSDRKS